MRPSPTASFTQGLLQRDPAKMRGQQSVTQRALCHHLGVQHRRKGTFILINLGGDTAQPSSHLS